MKASALSQTFTPVPQVLKSIRTSSFAPLNDLQVRRTIEEAENVLNKDQGRLLIRKSGTEPLIRVMAQGDNEGALTKVVHKIIESIEIADNSAAA